MQTQHHDDARFTQPAFNIAASAQGALNEWRYQDIRAQINTTNIVQLWNRADASDRQLLLSALRTSSIGQATLNTAMQHIDTHPQLAAASVLGAGDVDSAIQIVSTASVNVALDIVKTAIANNSQFPKSTTIDILEAATPQLRPGGIWISAQ